MIQRSLVLLKPDSIFRGIVGEIMHRFERAGLKIIGAKLLHADLEVVKNHYSKDPTWHKTVGVLSLSDCDTFGLSAEEIFGTTDAVEVGKIINEWLFDMLTNGPVFAFVLEGSFSVAKIRSLVGSTYPDKAPPGTIRGDFGLDSVYSSMKRKRAVLNLIHASGTPEEAVEEIKLWFKDSELLSYKRTDEAIYSY